MAHAVGRPFQTYILYHNGHYVDEGTAPKLARIAGKSISYIKWLANPVAHARQNEYHTNVHRWEVFRVEDIEDE